MQSTTFCLQIDNPVIGPKISNTPADLCARVCQSNTIREISKTSNLSEKKKKKKPNLIYFCCLGS